jgi:hypothetical protein
MYLNSKSRLGRVTRRLGRLCEALNPVEIYERIRRVTSKEYKTYAEAVKDQYNRLARIGLHQTFQMRIDEGDLNEAERLSLDLQTAYPLLPAGWIAAAQVCVARAQRVNPLNTEETKANQDWRILMTDSALKNATIARGKCDRLPLSYNKRFDNTCHRTLYDALVVGGKQMHALLIAMRHREAFPELDSIINPPYGEPALNPTAIAPHIEPVDVTPSSISGLGN